MAETSVASLPAALQKQVESARSAFAQGNDARVIELCRVILAAAPACLPVRKLQRAAQLRQTARPSGFLAKALGGMSTAPFRLTGNLQLGRDPAKALESAERMLETDPFSRAGLNLLGEAATALGWHETAVFAYEALREIEPDNPATLVALGWAQLAAGRPPAAVQSAEAALRIESFNGPAQTLLKDASVALTMKAGRWEDGGDFRGKLKS